MQKIILCYSGGLDSTIARYVLKPDLAVYYNLNTLYSKKEIANIEKMQDVFISNRLNLSEFEIGEKAYIPFRNLYLAMLSYSEAVKRFPDADLYRINLVGVKGDNVPDKNPEAFKKMTDLLNFINKKELPRVVVESPFWNFTKGKLVEMYKNDIDFRSIVSCYSKEEGRCGECPACFRFWVALESNGIECWNWFKKDIRKWKGIKEYIKNLNTYETTRREEIIRTLKKYDLYK